MSGEWPLMAFTESLGFILGDKIASVLREPFRSPSRTVQGDYLF